MFLIIFSRSKLYVMRKLAALMILVPMISWNQMKQTINFTESNNKNSHASITFDGSTSKYVYASSFNVALISNGNVEKSCKWSYKDLLKYTYFNAEKNQFFGMDGFSNVKDLIHIDFNAAVPKANKISLGSAKINNNYQKGNINLEMLDNDNVRISCIGDNKLKIIDVNIKTGVITTVFEKSTGERNTVSYVFKKSKGDFYYYASAETKAENGNKKTLELKHFLVDCQTKQTEVEQTETIELNCEVWNLQSYSDFLEEGSASVALVYSRHEGESVTIGMHVVIDDFVSEMKTISFEIPGVYKSASLNDYNLLYQDGKIHLFNNVEFFIEKRSTYGTLHVTINLDGEVELEQLKQGSYPYEYVTTKALKQELPVSKTTHITRNVRINKNQFAIYQVADEKKGKLIQVYVYDYEIDK